MRQKLLQLLYDLLLNDESIIDDGFYCRDTVGDESDLKWRLFNLIKEADLQVVQEYQMRDYIFNILYRLY